MVEPHQLALSPLAGLVPSVLDASPSEASSSVRPLVRAWTTSNLHAGQFTAACGVLVSHSDQLAPAWGHVLTCEPTGSLVQRRSLKRADGRSVVADESPQREFLASRDPWFRPVNLTEGPGGEIFVVDMYRAVIEHPDWVPVEQKHRPDERFGEGMGRIYRITSKASPVSGIWQQIRSRPMRQWSIEELVEAAGRPEAWVRATAMRLLIEKSTAPDGEVHAIFKRSLEYRGSHSLVIGFLTWLASRQKWDDATWQKALESEDSVLQKHAIHLLFDDLEPRSIAGYLGQFSQILKTRDRELLRAVCWATARSPEDSDEVRHFRREMMLPALAGHCLLSPTDGYLQMAIGAAVKNLPVEWMRVWGNQWHSLQAGPPGAISVTPILQKSVRYWMRAAAEIEPRAMQEAIGQWIPKEQWGEMGDDTRRFHLAFWSGLRDATGPEELTSLVALQGLLEATSRNSHWDPDLRSESLMLLRSISPAGAALVADELLEVPHRSLLKAAIGAVAHDATDAMMDRLILAYSKATPELRQEFFQVFRSSPKGLAKLLSQMESGQISSRLLDASQRESILGKADLQDKDRWTKVLGPLGDPDRQAVIDRYRLAFQGDWDVEHGKVVFGQHCAVCHRIDQTGTAVGPDISDSREQTFDKLLVSILDPNRTIDGAYYRYVVALESGEVVEGLLQESTADVVTLKSQNGATHRLMREEIESFQSTGNSLMPVGIEQQISPREMVDLLAYIKNWRYLQQGLPIQASPPKTAAP
jgi:putative heme-binding domain-containing protein